MAIVTNLFKGFIGIGVALLAVQVGAAKYLAPPSCGGYITHHLVDPYFPRVDDAAALSGVSAPPLTYSLVVKVVRWLPDLYTEVLAGDMSVGDFLRGGPVCHPPFKFPQSIVTPLVSSRLLDGMQERR
jgi:hypothetical protein